jgi:transcriptional regulator with XRE-family HTH domain
MTANHPLARFRASKSPPLGQADLGALVGVGRSTVHRWESGARKIDIDLLPRIVELTGIPASELRPDLAELFQVGEGAP